MAGALVYERGVEQDLDIGIGEVEVSSPGGGKMKGRRVNIASFAFATEVQTWDPGSIDPSGFESVSIPIVGITNGDFVMASFTGIPHSQVILHATVYNGNVIVALVNNALIAHNPGSGTLRVAVFKTNLSL